MILAAKAGIRVFATGGIGGVHRGAEVTMDISADLKELSQTPVTVVCSGVKSILDIPKTLEVLEYHGVPVFGYKTEIFPAFFTNDSGYKSPLLATSSLDIARAMICQDDLGGLSGQGMLVAVPNPSPADTLHIEECIQQALREAEAASIRGAAVTPFVLSRVKDLTKGSSLDANISLVCNNARVASEIAVEYAPLAIASLQEGKRKQQSQFFASSQHTSISVSSRASVPSSSSSSGSSSTSPPALKNKTSVIVFGGAVVDQMMVPSRAGQLSTSANTPRLIMSTSNPGTISISYGGVGRNIAEGLARLGYCTPTLVTAVGTDPSGHGLLQHAMKAGIDISEVIQTEEKGEQSHTATYAAVHDHTGDLVVAIADMDIFHKLITPQVVRKFEQRIRSSELVVVDGNVSPGAFSAVASMCSQFDVPLFFEPTSVHKCTLPIIANSLSKVCSGASSCVIQSIHPNPCLSCQIRSTLLNRISQSCAKC
jgi:pseudouridylate synthase / pseudouridine kinase